MSENNGGYPSLMALLGLVAVAGYQNRDKLSEWFGGSQGTAPAPQDRPEGLDRVLPQDDAARSGGIGGMLGGGIKDLIDKFTQGGRGSTADSWIGPGQNEAISESDLEQTIGPDVIDALVRRTGMSREELLARLSRNLPDAIDRYTPGGRMPA